MKKTLLTLLAAFSFSFAADTKIDIALMYKQLQIDTTLAAKCMQQLKETNRIGGYCAIFTSNVNKVNYAQIVKYSANIFDFENFALYKNSIADKAAIKQTIYNNIISNIKNLLQLKDFLDKLNTTSSTF